MDIVVLFGPPGAGKGTQGALLSTALNLPHYSTGDILRAEQGALTARGAAIDALMKAGTFATDEMMLAIIADLLVSDTCARGVILDGFPRTLVQASALDELAAELDFTLPLAIELIIPDPIAAERLRGRGRADDSAPLVARRISAYHHLTAPLHDYYAPRRRLVEIVADDERECVLAHLLAGLAHHGVR